MEIKIDEDVFGEILDGEPEEQPGEAAESTPPLRCDGATIFDIETGPRDWSEIEGFWKAPEKPGVFDPNSVKYGNTKDAAKRAAKLEEAKLAHAALVADFDAEIEKSKQELLGKAALSPVTGRVLAIGYLDKQCDIDGLTGENTEAAILETFWEYYGTALANRDRLVGFNIYGFDLPFIVRRSWLLGVDVPSDVIRDNRYWNKVFIDLMQVWGCGNYGERISLDNLCQFFGGPRKNGDGAEFSKLWLNPETRQQAIEYLANDLRMTLEAARKMGVV